jgi:large subunit ribosomal protein L24
MEKIRNKDQIIVIAGRDKGKKGEVLTSNVKEDKVIVKGINILKKSVKKSKENPKGGFVEVEMPLSVSNVMMFCTKCNKGVRVGIKITDSGKVRFCKKCDHKFE